MGLRPRGELVSPQVKVPKRPAAAGLGVYTYISGNRVLTGQDLEKGYAVDGLRLGAEWRRSARCESGACVEVARSGIFYAVRDSTHPDGPKLRFSVSEWSDFLRAVCAGEFDNE